MKAIILGIVLGISLLAQDMPEAAKKHLAETVAQFGTPEQNHTFQFISGQLMGGDAVKGAPYSAEAVTQTTQTLADGSHILNSTSSMIYRDSEGRERREESIAKLGTMNAEGPPVKAVFISDPVAKVGYSLDAASRTAHKIAGLPGTTTAGVASVKPGTTVSINRSFSASTGTAVGGPVVLLEARTVGGNDESEQKIEKLGTQAMEGVQVEGTRTTRTIPAGQIGNERDINIVSERWYSQELHVLIVSKHSDPRMGETVYKLTNINRAEPLHSMFEVPPDYSISEPPMMKMRTPQGKEENQDNQNNFEY